MNEVQISVPTLNRSDWNLQGEPQGYLSVQAPDSLLASRGQPQIRSAAAIRLTKGGEMEGSAEAIPTSGEPTVMLTCIRPGRRFGKHARAGPVFL